MGLNLNKYYQINLFTKMSNFKQLNHQQPKIIIDNEDQAYNNFLKLLYKSRLLVQGTHFHQLKCKMAPPRATLGNKIKKNQIQMAICEGQYKLSFNNTDFTLLIQKGEAKLVTECRNIQYLKRLVVFGENISAIKQFVKYVFELGNDEPETEQIIIYENTNGHWGVSKSKKPRKLESVIFKEQFIKSVLQDVDDFINSQEWYIEMGIPYKRSYLLFGPPGTGKSSFAQALAAEIKHSICFVNCSDQINDFNFNRLLNMAPKKSIILIEDVDAIFSERKNAQKLNALTFSGFLNAIDGVRSQQGRIIIMTTNFKDRLDPALLRPGRVDEMYEIGYSIKYQIEKLCNRFFKNEQLAKQFAARVPENKFPMSLIQGFLLKFRKFPQKILDNIDEILNNDENVKIEVYLKEINCLDCLNNFRIEQVFTLAQAKNLPKSQIQKISNKLNSLLKGRLIETIRMDRKNYIKSEEALFTYIEQSVADEEKQRKLRKFVRDENIKTIYLIRDELKRLQGELPQDSK